MIANINIAQRVMISGLIRVSTQIMGEVKQEVSSTTNLFKINLVIEMMTTI
jgi:hypothetical protein